MWGQKWGDSDSILVSEARDERDESNTSIKTTVSHTPLHPSHGGGSRRFISESNTWDSGEVDTPAPGSGRIRLLMGTVTLTDSESRGPDNAMTSPARQATRVFDQLRISNAPGSSHNCQFTLGMPLNGIHHELSLANSISAGPHDIMILYRVFRE